MIPVFAKLNLGTLRRVAVLDAPIEFEAVLAELQAALPELKLRRTMPRTPGRTPFALAFVTTLAQVERAAAALSAVGTDDVVLWFAYPKSSSKRLRCEFNRDTGWASLGEHGFAPVRMVAIDADWSALRFRRIRHIGGTNIHGMKRGPSRMVGAAGRV
ncbi:MAG: hypothetical protein RLZZ598_108 [Pseudomonadota bacterium]